MRREAGPMMRIAGPLVAAELGWMFQGVVDTMMVGRLPDSAAAIAGSAIGGMAFYYTVIFLEGILFGMDPLVAQAFGAKRYDDCHRTFMASLYFVLPVAPLHMWLVWQALPWMRMYGIDHTVMAQAEAFTSSLMWSTLPLLLYMAARHYLQAMDHVKIVMFTLISANLVNWFFNWLLIFGNWGLPAMGVEGSGWATVIARCYMAALMLGYILRIDRRDRLHVFRAGLRARLGDVLRIFRFGVPAAIQIGFELAVFAISLLWIGTLGALPLAAHQVALNVVATTYMVPLGIGAAASVRVGQALGRGDAAGARGAGWVAIGMGGAFMALCGIVLLLVPASIARLFTDDASVIAAAASLLLVGAMFQLFDGIQAVASGALRGAGLTRISMVAFLVGYWTAGLPLGYWLCFRQGWGARGLWVGFLAGLGSIAVVLVAIWRVKSRQFRPAAA